MCRVYFVVLFEFRNSVPLVWSCRPLTLTDTKYNSCVSTVHLNVNIIVINNENVLEMEKLETQWPVHYAQ
jgi:hypothetical protein